MSRRPNILIVLTDQMRSTALGCAGVEKLRTPHLDPFAAQGMRFSNAVSNTPACAPARASLLTGLHVFSHGLINNEMSLRTDATSIAHAFGTAGYDCAYIGKWHVDGVNRGAYIPPGPRRQGFDTFWAGTECNHNYFAGYYYDDATREPVWFNCYEPEGQTDLAVDFIERRDGDRPFLLVVSWSPPHCPYQKAPQQYLDMYPPDEIEFLPNAVSARVQSPNSKMAESAPMAFLPADEADRFKRETIAGYYAHVSALDACFGRLMDALHAGGLDDETIVLFTSDHGDMLFSQNCGWKTKPWRESVGIPFLIRWPGHIPAGRQSRCPVSLVDVMPTLLGLAGVTVPMAVEGADLSAVMLGDEESAPASAWINFPCTPSFYRTETWRGVVTRTHTYAETRDGPWLLYDDVADPFQMTNLAGRAECANIQHELAREVRQWLKRTADEFPPARQVADRHMPGHVNHILPIPPLEPVILDGQKQRAGNHY